MNSDPYRIFPLGDSALTVEFGREISLALNKRAQSLAAFFIKNPFPGLVEVMPAYASTAIFYDPLLVRQEFGSFKTAFEAVNSLVRENITRGDELIDQKSRSVEIEVDFSAEGAIDLPLVAAKAKLSEADVIRIFISRTYRVYMLGFLPGFAYMGEVDERIASPRKASPRTKIPKGSVGIAGRQTGIYPLESPGGWQIIGRTAKEMFRPQATEPSLLQPGDTVRFIVSNG